MKLNWFSPLPPAETDVAHYSVRLLAALSARAEVTLWTDQEVWDKSLERLAPVRRYEPEAQNWAEVNRADINIFNIGNNTLFHKSIWMVSHQCPGIVILHDQRLQHFFTGLFKLTGNDRAGYLSAMQLYYGGAGRRDGEAFWDASLSTEFMAEHYPLTPLAVENATGVIVHTTAAFEYFKSELPLPVIYSPLPYKASPIAESPSNDLKPGQPPYRIVIFGYLGHNRRLDVVLRALAQMPEKDRFRLDIYGQILDKETLTSQIQALGLKRVVKVQGFVKEKNLDAALASAHLAINLRYPTMGEASGSQLRIWNHSLPSLVTKIGWYESSPEDSVAFVRPEHEIDDIQSHLRNFLADPKRYLEIGKNGRRILETEHDPETFARAVINFVPVAQRFRLRKLAFDLANRAGTEIGTWNGSMHSGDGSESVAKAINELIGHRNH